MSPRDSKPWWRMAGIWDAGFKDVMANLVARCPKPLKSTAVPTNKEVTVSIAVTPTPAPGLVARALRALSELGFAG